MICVFLCCCYVSCHVLWIVLCSSARALVCRNKKKKKKQCKALRMHIALYEYLKYQFQFNVFEIRFKVTHTKKIGYWNKNLQISRFNWRRFTFTFSYVLLPLSFTHKIQIKPLIITADNRKLCPLMNKTPKILWCSFCVKIRSFFMQKPGSY